MVALAFFNVTTRKCKIVYVSHIYDRHYNSTGQYYHRTNRIGTKIVSPSGLIWDLFCFVLSCFVGEERRGLLVL